MTPGIETDSMIARKIWRAIVVNDNDSGASFMVEQKTQNQVPIPAFSTELEEANKIVEFFQAKGWFFRVQSVPEENVFRAVFYKEDSRTYKFMKSETMPMVICEAAIAAINGTNLM